MRGLRVEFTEILIQGFPRAPHSKTGIRLFLNVKGKDIGYEDLTKEQLKVFIEELQIYEKRLPE